jgi:hypothetical protein
MNFWIPTALAILFELIKNPATAEKYKKALVKLARAVDMLFPGEVCKGVDNV